MANQVEPQIKTVVIYSAALFNTALQSRLSCYFKAYLYTYHIQKMEYVTYTD